MRQSGFWTGAFFCAFIFPLLNKPDGHFEITAERTVKGEQMDVNVLSSAYERNVVSLVKEAIAQENIGEVGVYYAKKEATTLIPAGVRFPVRIQEMMTSSPIIRSFDEKVNMKIVDATQSQQFKRWFGDWQNHPEDASKVVNEDGTPKVVYHGTNEDFTVFDSKSGVYWFSETKEYAEAKAEERDGDRVVSAYLSMQNPLYAKLSLKEFSDPAHEAPLVRQAKEGGHNGVIIETDVAHGTRYAVTISIGMKDGVGTVYNVGKIKRPMQRQTPQKSMTSDRFVGSRGENSGSMHTSVSDITVSRDRSDVNSQYMQNFGKNAQRAVAGESETDIALRESAAQQENATQKENTQKSTAQEDTAQRTETPERAGANAYSDTYKQSKDRY